MKKALLCLLLAGLLCGQNPASRVFWNHNAGRLEWDAQYIPTSLTALWSTRFSLNELVVSATCGQTVLITIQDGNGMPLVKNFAVPSGTVATFGFAGRPFAGGLYWSANVASCAVATVVGQAIQ